MAAGPLALPTVRRWSLGAAAEIGGVTLALRLGLLLATLGLFHVGLDEYVRFRDGGDYLRYAEAIRQLDLSALGGYHARLYPGYPLVLAVLGPPLGGGVAGLLVSMLGAAAACLLFYQATGDRWLARYFYLLPPAWLLFSAVVMSEGLFMALQLGALLLFTRGRPLPAAAVLGLAAVVRPVSVLLAGAMLLALVWQRRWRALLPFALLTALPSVGWMAVSYLAWGNLFANVTHYGATPLEGTLVGLPFQGILAMLLSGQVPLWKQAYVLVNIGVSLAGIAVAAWQFFRVRDAWTLLLFVWITSSVLFYASIGMPWWAFNEYVRYIITFFPALLIVLSPLLPRTWWLVGPLGLASAAMALVAMSHSVELMAIP
jgi:hypothetical protein